MWEKKVEVAREVRSTDCKVPPLFEVKCAYLNFRISYLDTPYWGKGFRNCIINSHQ